MALCQWDSVDFHTEDLYLDMRNYIENLGVTKFHLSTFKSYLKQRFGIVNDDDKLRQLKQYMQRMNNTRKVRTYRTKRFAMVGTTRSGRVTKPSLLTKHGLLLTPKEVAAIQLHVNLLKDATGHEQSVFEEKLKLLNVELV